MTPSRTILEEAAILVYELLQIPDALWSLHRIAYDITLEDRVLYPKATGTTQSGQRSRTVEHASRQADVCGAFEF